MQIDVVTIIAQIINFLILALLLRRFLYGPIVRTMDEREKQIADQINGAKKAERRAEREAGIAHKERTRLEDQRGIMLSKAQEEAEEWKRQQIEQARHEVEEMEARWRRALEREKETFLHDLRRRAGEEVYYVARKALSDLAGVELEHRMADVFMQRLRHIPADEWQQIALAARRAGDQAIVTSAFSLDADMQIRMRNVIQDQLEKHGVEAEAGETPESVKIVFQQSPDLISGIELIAGGRRAAWSLENYLESLEENITQAFKLNGGAMPAGSAETGGPAGAQDAPANEPTPESGPGEGKVSEQPTPQ